MKRFARIAAALSAACFALAALVGLSSCGEPPSPSEVADSSLKQVSGITVDELIQMAGTDEAKAAGIDISSVEQYFGSESTLTEDQQAAMKTIVNKIYDFDYTIGEETISGDTATVKVTFKTYDLGPALKEVVTATISKATEDAAAGKSVDTDALTNQLFADMASAAEGLTEKTLETEVPLTFTKVNGEWTMDSLTSNADFQKAFVGSLQDVFASVSG